MSVPLLGDLSLEFVQQIEHCHDSGFASTRIAGLAGELQQRGGRLSHRILIEGILFGETAADDLKSLQQAAAAGDELTFSADISAALDLQKVVIGTLYASELAGRPNRYGYRIQLVESPPLPPPAEVGGFGGLDDFGLGDLGFDTDILGDLEDLAGEVAGAVDQALDVIDQLGALASLDVLQLGNFLAPVGDSVSRVGELGSRFRDATRDLAGLFS